tara:strand:+ start:661 stop:1023 length:363 start_codon:yes stop_codon:yes gene_type:complete
MEHYTLSEEVTRDGSGNSISVTYTIKRYSPVTIVEKTTTTKESSGGNTVKYDWPDCLAENLKGTRTVTYNIPESDRTTATHEEPHVHANEMAYQEKSILWKEAARQSSDWQTAIKELESI